MPERLEVEGYASTKHPLWALWGAMHQRCTNPNRNHFHRYGGRGIRVCEQWQDFRQFVAGVNECCGPRPSEKHTLDRIDNDGNYEPGNVKWSDPFEQGANTERTTLVEYKGEMISRPEAARRVGISHSALRRRMREWPEELWFKPLGYRHVSTADVSQKGRNTRLSNGELVTVEVDGKTMCLKQAAEAHGISYATVHSRRQDGWPEEDWFKPVGYVRCDRQDVSLKACIRNGCQMVEIDGELLTIGQACKRFGIGRGTAYGRIKMGWPESRWFEPVK